MPVLSKRTPMLGVLICSFLLGAPNLLQAAVIPLDLSIGGDLEFDEEFALEDGTGITNTSLTARQGGTDTIVDWTGDVPNGVNPLLGTFTKTGDGFRIFGTASATSDGEEEGEFATGVDLVVDLSNSSATDTYEVFFRIDFSNSVTATGDDAFADSEFTLDTPPGTEVFFTQTISDTLGGNKLNGVLTGGSGGTVADSDIFTFSLVLAPLDDTSIKGDWTMEGGAFASEASVDFDAFLSVERVDNLTEPGGVIPEPGSVLIWSVLGALGMAVARRRRKAGSLA